MKSPVYLHVGLKKTGTSYLQSVFRASTTELERQGLALVPRHEPAGHRLARAVLGRPVAGDPLAALPRQLAAARGDRVLLSQETLGRASARQIARLAAPLAGYDVHVVVTVRDVARTVPSAWQQYVQARNTLSYDAFVESVVSGRTDGPAEDFWRNHGAVDLLERWSELASPDACHVVLVPPPGSPPEELLDRYCRVLGVDASRLVRDRPRVNESLGMAQTELMRRLNLTPGDHPPWVHGAVYKRGFARGVLAAQPGRRPLMPAATRPWCTAYTRGVVEALARGGYDVIGDPADLDPPDSAFTEGTQHVSDAEVATVAVAALRSLLEEQGRQAALAREAAGPGPEGAEP